MHPEEGQKPTEVPVFCQPDIAFLVDKTVDRAVFVDKFSRPRSLCLFTLLDLRSFFVTMIGMIIAVDNERGLRRRILEKERRMEEVVSGDKPCTRAQECFIPWRLRV